MRAISVHALEAHAGESLGTSDWYAVDQPRVDLFADATDDHNWIHVDIERAARERGDTIAHGFLVLSLVPTMLTQLMRVTDTPIVFNYGLNRVRFVGEVRTGDSIRLQARIGTVEHRVSGMLAVFECTVESRATGKPVCFAELLALHVLPVA